MRKLKALWLVVTFVTIVLGPTAIGWYVQQNRNPDLGSDPAATPGALIASGSLDAALESCDFLIAYDLDPDGSVEETRRELFARINSLSAKAKGFVWGGLTGNIEDPSSLAGCIAADLTVYGDARDLFKNAAAYVRGEEVDELVTVLSTIGLATTLAPHIDVGISVCKNLSRFMAKAIRSHILDLALEAKKLGKLDKIAGLVSDIGGLWKKLGGATLEIFRMAADVPGFNTLVRVIDGFGRPAFGAVLVGGKSTLRVLTVASDAGLKMIGAGGKRMIRMAVLYPNVAVHLMKVAKKAGWDHPDLTMILLAEILAVMPLWLIATVGAAVWLWCSGWGAAEVAFGRAPNPAPEPTA